LLPAIVCFSLLEIGLRLVGFQFIPSSDFIFFTHTTDEWTRIVTYDPQVMWRMKPGEIHYYQKQYHINAKGYRGEDFDANKPPDRTRIIVVGDSTPFGHGVEAEETFIALTRENLTSRFPQVEMLNCAVMSYSSFQIRQDLQARIFAYQPDVLILYPGGWNEHTWGIDYTDRELKGIASTLTPRGIVYRLRTLQFFRWMPGRTLKSRLQKDQIEILTRNNERDFDADWKRRVPLPEFRQDLLWIIEHTQERDIALVLLVPVLPLRTYLGLPVLREYQKVVRDLPVPETVQRIDLEQFFDRNRDAGMFNDFAHPNAAGHRAIAQALTPILVDLLTQTASQEIPADSAAEPTRDSSHLATQQMK
jgi:hypothetical protein